MIHEFAVENFLSFKEEQILSFEATASKAFENFYVVKKGNFRLLKICLLYGANGSGKTNLLKALAQLKQLTTVASSHKDAHIPIIPFLLDEESKTQPTRFRLSFFVGDTRYIYLLALTRTHIVKEKLSFYPGTQPAILFHRQYDAESRQQPSNLELKLDYRQRKRQF
ncbi:MAG: AAA family ATPase [Bacteroidota bacterium]